MQTRDRTEQHAHAQSVFPGHDGLGSFRVDHPVQVNDAQEQMYQFERFNPRRVHRRRESFERGQAQLEQTELPQESEKRRRIEAWRLEHSRILLDEVKRETRRRRCLRCHRMMDRLGQLRWDCRDRTMSWTSQGGTMRMQFQMWQTRKASWLGSRAEYEIFWGIDDRMMAILMGDATVDEDDLSSTPTASRNSRNGIIAGLQLMMIGN